MCNERFGHSMIPVFCPMIRPIEESYWYLAEDYAFCERARQCGFKIYADTTIRLWHVGTYRYGWEDAGIERQRFGSFTLNFGKAPGTPQATPTQELPALANFAAEYPWPAEKPNVPPFPQRDGTPEGTREILSRSVSPSTRLIVEVGSWVGRSTRFLANLAPQAKVIAIDHWQGSPEHKEDPELAQLLPRLYETFLAECWGYRDQIIPVKADIAHGLERVAEAGLEPEVVYLDADHSFEAAQRDVSLIMDLFPKTMIVGDDWDWEGVRQAVETIARDRHVRYEAYGTGWRILR